MREVGKWVISGEGARIDLLKDLHRRHLELLFFTFWG